MRKRGSGQPRSRETYEWRPWTPPSICADIVLFSNFSSPEYIMELARERGGGGLMGPGSPHGSPLHGLTAEQRGFWRQCPGSRAGCQQSGMARTCGWSPCPGWSRKRLAPPSPCPPRCKARQPVEPPWQASGPPA
uniref:Uncharacterized protein n=1 Tax=Naja naja TaxID=35670 RepID=A0A8C6YG90_NAJNA